MICFYCTKPLTADDHGTLVDNTGGDVCGSYGTFTNEPHAIDVRGVIVTKTGGLYRDRPYRTEDWSTVKARLIANADATVRAFEQAQGTEGQDRESYTDDQDRDEYTVNDEDIRGDR